MGGEITQADRIEGVALKNNAPLGFAEFRWLAFLALAIVAFVYTLGFEYVVIAFPAAFLLFCLLFPQAVRMLGDNVGGRGMWRDGRMGKRLAFFFANKWHFYLTIMFAALAIMCVVNHIAVRFEGDSDWANRWMEMVAPLTLSLFPLFDQSSVIDLGKWNESGRMADILPSVHVYVVSWIGCFFAHVALYVGAVHSVFMSIGLDIKRHVLLQAGYDFSIMDIGKISFKDIDLYYGDNRGILPHKDVSAKILRRLRVSMGVGMVIFLTLWLALPFLAREEILGNMSSEFGTIGIAIFILFMPIISLIAIWGGYMFFTIKPREWATLK